MKRTPLALICFALFTLPAAAQSTFAGAWDTTFGRLTLTQDADQVRGFYLMGRLRCPLEGKVEKSRLTFTYREGTTTGEGWFELAGDGQSFKGEWRAKGETEWQPWEAKRVGKKTATTFDGLWDTTYGRMRLVQRASSIEGVYSFTSESTIAGKMDGKRLVFHYKEPNAEGEGWFELSADGQSFHGKWKTNGSEAWADWTGERIDPVPGQVWLIVIEANWEESLADPEYSFGAMLRAFFARTPNVQIRHRFFTDEASLKKWCREVAYLAEPAVVSLATHGCKDGASVCGHTIGAKALADSFRYASNVRLLNFSACEMMKDSLAREVIDALGKDRAFPISGYTTVVDWAASAIIEFTYYELILARNMPPDKAAKQLVRLLPFAGDKNSPGAAFKAAGFRLVMPGEK